MNYNFSKRINELNELITNFGFMNRPGSIGAAAADILGSLILGPFALVTRIIGAYSRVRNDEEIVDGILKKYQNPSELRKKLIELKNSGAIRGQKCTLLIEELDGMKPGLQYERTVKRIVSRNGVGKWILFILFESGIYSMIMRSADRNKSSEEHLMDSLN